MRLVRSVAAVLVVFAPVWLGVLAPDGAQALARRASAVNLDQAVTAADLQQLDATADTIALRLPALQRSDRTLAAQVEKSLADLRDEITYLKVKLKKDNAVARPEYIDVRDRLETLRIKSQAQAATVQAQPALDEPMEKIWTVPVGTIMDVRLQTALNSGTAKAEQRFETTTVTDFIMGRDVVLPAGTVVRGFVSSVKAAGTIDRKGSLTLSFDEVIFNRGPHRLRASITQALDGKMGAEAGKIGAGAVVGGIIGGLLGGGKGALAGVLIGGGGTMAATEGANVDLPVGTILRLRVDQPLEVTIVK